MMTRFGSKNLLALGSVIRKHQQKRITTMRPRIQKVQLRVSSRNIQRTTRSKDVDDEGYEGRDNDHNRQRGDRSVVIEPRSYRDVVVNGGSLR